MLFKNLTLLKYAGKFSPDMQEMEAALEKNRFVSCSASQALSIGWVEPRGIDNGPLVEFVSGQWLMKLMIEDKPVPAGVVKRRVLDLCNQIEKESGRRPGHKYRKELREQVLEELLPLAFPRQRSFWVWLDPKHQWVMVDASSKAHVGAVSTALVSAFAGMAISDLQTKTSPSVGMMQWLLEGADGGWNVDMDCELRSDNELKSVLRYARHPLDTAEIREHLENGMQPVQLAMTWRDRVSLVLTSEMKLKRISFLDVVFEGNPHDTGEDAFDADAAIATGELLPLLEELVDMLDGEQKPVG